MNSGPQQAVERRHIDADPRICGGKPCVIGTRIRMWDIHVWHDLQGMTPEEIVAEFSQLSVADVHAALAYYHDHRELLERQNRQAQDLVEELGRRYPSKIQGRLGKDAENDSISS